MCMYRVLAITHTIILVNSCGTEQSNIQDKQNQESEAVTDQIEIRKNNKLS